MISRFLLESFHHVGHVYFFSWPCLGLSSFFDSKKTSEDVRQNSRDSVRKQNRRSRSFYREDARAYFCPTDLFQKLIVAASLYSSRPQDAGKFFKPSS